MCHGVAAGPLGPVQLLPPLERSWPATPDNVRSARTAVLAYLAEAGAAAPIDDIALAVTEAATTIVGNSGRPGDRFTVGVRVREDTIVVTVDDGGDGVVPRRSDPRHELSEPVISGVSDGFVRRTGPDGSTQLWMLFAHGAQPS